MRRELKDDKDLDESTKTAQKAEQDRMKRLQEARARALGELRSKLPTPYHEKKVISVDDQSDDEAIKKEEKKGKDIKLCAQFVKELYNYVFPLLTFSYFLLPYLRCNRHLIG